MSPNAEERSQKWAKAALNPEFCGLWLLLTGYFTRNPYRLATGACLLTYGALVSIRDAVRDLKADAA